MNLLFKIGERNARIYRMEVGCADIQKTEFVPPIAPFQKSDFLAADWAVTIV